MNVKNTIRLVLVGIAGFSIGSTQAQHGRVDFVDLKEVTVQDSFWSPKFKIWNEVTITDVL